MLGFPNNEINYTSPINPNMGGMYSIPPNPIGNIANIGNYGYNQGDSFSMFMNSPYYTNNFTYVNPYALLQQQKAMEAARKEQLRQQSETMKSISRMVHQSLGDMDGEELERYLEIYDYETENKELIELAEQVREYNRLANLKPVTPNYAYINYFNRVSESFKKNYPDNMSLSEYLDKAGELYRQSLIYMYERREKNGKLKYDSDQFNKLVDLHRTSSSYFNGILTGNNNSVDIGDLEIKIPDGERPKMVLNMPSKLQEYAARKQAFIQACLNSNTKTLG